MRGLYGHLSGLAVPTFALDAPGGRGKIPLTPEYVLEYGDNLVFSNYCGEICTYPESATHADSFLRILLPPVRG